MKRIHLHLFFLFFPLIPLFSTEGLKYSHLSRFQSIYVIEIDPSLYEIKPVKALDNGIGRESVLSLSKRHGAVAAINGGFFTADGTAAGALKIQDWYQLPLKPRGCIGWSSTDKNPKMDRLLAKVEGSCNQTTFSIDGLNRARKQGEMILFTPCFHRSTLTCLDGEEVVVIDGMVQSIVKGGSTKIPENGQILSIQKSHPLFGTFEAGMPLSFSTQVTPLLESFNDWDSLDYIVGGIPLLILHGTQITDFESEKTIASFLSSRHARTAVGILPNGHWLFVVVDKLGFLDGMTIFELVELMESFGCVEALNLDGGGSSTMVYDGEIKNSPRGDKDESDGQKIVRRVSDALVVLPKLAS